MATENHIVMFAYGSNMFTARLQARVPSAKAIGIGQLKGHVLKWHKRSDDDSGKCDVEFTGSETDAVCGVLFEINASEKHILDRAEGLNNGYAEKEVAILSSVGVVQAKVYYATEKDPTLKPYDWYKAFVVAGAHEHNLPGDIISALESVVSMPDLDRKRAAENAKLLSGGFVTLNE